MAKPTSSKILWTVAIVAGSMIINVLCSFFLPNRFFSTVASIGILIFAIRRIIKVWRDDTDTQSFDLGHDRVDHGSARWSNWDDLIKDGFNTNWEGLWVANGVWRSILSLLILSIKNFRIGAFNTIIISV